MDRYFHKKVVIFHPQNNSILCSFLKTAKESLTVFTYFKFLMESGSNFSMIKTFFRPIMIRTGSQLRFETAREGKSIFLQNCLGKSFLLTFFQLSGVCIYVEKFWKRGGGGGGFYLALFYTHF